EKAGDLIEFATPTHERCEGGGEVVAEGAGAPQGWEIAGQGRVPDLENPFRAGQIGQAVVTEVEQRHLVRELVGGEVGGDGGTHDLPTPGGGQQPGRPVERGAK